MKVVLGARDTKYDGWVSTDIDELDIKDPDNWERLYKENSLDALLLEHVLEHLSLKEGKIAAKCMYKYLKQGGYVRCAVPDKYFDNEWYQNMVQVGGPGPKDHPAYTHKIVYDYKKLITVFEEAGFKVKLLEYCDENHQFHHTHWDETKGMINRSYRFDTRNSEDKLGMVSIIIDAYKL